MTESQEYKKRLVAQLLDYVFGDNIIVECIDHTNEIDETYDLTHRGKYNHHVLTGRSTWTITVVDKSHNKKEANEKMPDSIGNTSPKVINECEYLRSIYGEQHETPCP